MNLNLPREIALDGLNKLHAVRKHRVTSRARLIRTAGETVTCPDCKGTGGFEVPETKPGWVGQPGWRVCTTCGGSGSVSK